MSRDPGGAEPSIAWAELASEELLETVREVGAELSIEALRQILRSPYLDEKVVTALLELPEIISSYEVRKLLVSSPRTPLARALQWVPGLYWKDLQDLARNLRVPPVVRRSAERYLVERLQGMAVGERISLARLATGLVLNQLRHDHHPRVFGALLENPRLTEGILLPTVASESTPAENLRLLAASSRWGSRYVIRSALVRNPKTPADISIRILPGLKKNDRAAVASNFKLPAAVRRRANVLLGKSPL